MEPMFDVVSFLLIVSRTDHMHHVGTTRRSPITNHTVVSCCFYVYISSLCVSKHLGGMFLGQRGFKKKQPTDVFQDGSPQIPSEEKATAQLAGKPEAAETNMGTPGDISRPFLVKIW